MVYHAPTQRLLLFGGDAGPSTLNDLWAWDGAAWSLVHVDGGPGGRRDHGMVYDMVRREVTVFGGEEGILVRNYFGDTWSLGYESSSPVETCVYGFDDDGDGLVGCADPDCAGVCDPLCDVLLSCSPTRTFAGDGSCDPLETFRLSPPDCGDCLLACGDLVCDMGEGASCPADCL